LTAARQTEMARSEVQFRSLVEASEIIGVVSDAEDLAAARAFYEPILRHAAGEWGRERDTLNFRSVGQSLRFRQRQHPRGTEETGRHQAYRVPAESLRGIIGELLGLGYVVDWWREDHPSERQVSAYLLDPDGNRVQLVESAAADLDQFGFLDHVGVEVHDLESAEVFYGKVLGGQVDYYHGRRARDYQEALAWEGGGDPCAPWTRLWPGAGLSTDLRHKSRVPHPNQQVFFRFGETRLAVVLAGKHRQEPPEEQAQGTPRIVFCSRLPVATIGARLSSTPFPLTPEDRLPLTFRVDGPVVYLRDPAGNFVQVDGADTMEHRASGRS